MTEAATQTDRTGWDEAAFEAMRARAEDCNLDPVTLLATDYLNHFNEVVMLLEMIPDMPEIIEDARAWKPKSYKDHFRDSTVADREIAVEAYDVVPPQYKEPFERTIAMIDRLILTSVERLGADIEEGNAETLRENATALSRTVQKLMDTASGIMHGSAKTLDQSEIDSLIGG